MKVKYTHFEEIHNLKSPNEIVPVLIDLFNPQSVLDVGCGIGIFLYVFKQFGVKKVMGIDGSWVDKEVLSKYITPGEFKEVDLEKNMGLETSYDLVLCLEVAEHLSDKAADGFIQNLIKAGQIIIFSAAVPSQGGQNHLNEQWIGYWENKFMKYGYRKYDIFKSILWNNPNVFYWYKQNMVVFSNKDLIFNVPENLLTNVVHADLYLGNSKRMDSYKDDLKGRLTPMVYLKLLVKSILSRIGLYKIK